MPPCTPTTPTTPLHLQRITALRNRIVPTTAPAHTTRLPLNLHLTTTLRAAAAPAYLRCGSVTTATGVTDQDGPHHRTLTARTTAGWFPPVYFPAAPTPRLDIFTVSSHRLCALTVSYLRSTLPTARLHPAAHRIPIACYYATWVCYTTTPPRTTTLCARTHLTPTTPFPGRFGFATTTRRAPLTLFVGG